MVQKIEVNIDLTKEIKFLDIFLANTYDKKEVFKTLDDLYNFLLYKTDDPDHVDKKINKKEKLEKRNIFLCILDGRTPNPAKTTDPIPFIIYKSPLGGDMAYLSTVIDRRKDTIHPQLFEAIKQKNYLIDKNKRYTNSFAANTFIEDKFMTIEQNKKLENMEEIISQGYFNNPKIVFAYFIDNVIYLHYKWDNDIFFKPNELSPTLLTYISQKNNIFPYCWTYNIFSNNISHLSNRNSMNYASFKLFHALN
jgi:hypothetical protein